MRWEAAKVESVRLGLFLRHIRVVVCWMSASVSPWAEKVLLKT